MKKRMAACAALAAVLATSVVVVTTASAEEEAPQFKTRSGGEVAKRGFKASGGAGELVGMETIKCARGATTGEIAGKSEVGHVVVTFSGCKDGTKKCHSPGAGEEEIRSVPLKGRLGDTSQAASGVGLVLEPESGTEYTTIEHCTVVSAKVTGKVIGEALPIGAFAKTGELVYRQSGGKQSVQTLNNGEGGHLEAFGESGLQASTTIEFEEEIEIV